MNTTCIDELAAPQRKGPSSIPSTVPVAGAAIGRRPTLMDALRVLIVGDDPSVCQVVAKMMRHLGWRTTAAEDAMMALYYLSREQYDVVVTDYDMPFIDGYELADQIKETHFGTKVIMMTGRGDSEVSDILEDSNVVDGLLLKPFGIQAIQKVIQKML